MKPQTGKPIQTTQTERAAMKSACAKTRPLLSIQLGGALVDGGPLLKRWLAFSAVLGLVAWATGVAKANDLFNDKLDDIAGQPVTTQQSPTPTGWTVDASLTISGASQDGASSETFANVLGPLGYGLFFKAFQGTVGFPADDLLTVHFYQDNPTTPGTKVTLSGYAAAEANYCGRFATNSPPPKS